FKTLTAYVSVSGSVRRAATKTLVGSAAIAGTIRRAIAKTLVGSAAIAGTIRRAIAKTLVGQVSVRAAVKRQTIYAGTDDGFMRKSATTWSGARDAAVADLRSYLTDTFRCGTGWDGSEYHIDRATLPFDASAIPAGSTVLAAMLNCRSSFTQELPTVHVVSYSGAVPNTVNDFASLGGTSLGSAPFGVGWNQIALSAAGLAQIVPGGTTTLGLRAGEDLDDSPPDAWVQTFIYAANSKYAPYLTVTYAGPLGKAVTKTLAAEVRATGAISRATNRLKTLVAYVAVSGSMTRHMIYQKALTAYVAVSGSLSRGVSKALSATAEGAGTIRRAIAKTLPGSATASGSIRRNTGKALRAQVGVAALIRRAVAKILTARVAASATMIRFYWIAAPAPTTAWSDVTAPGPPAWAAAEPPETVWTPKDKPSTTWTRKAKPATTWTRKG
ncbi:MAG: hypothetical protein PHU85_13580, partial [Phycisphaerae bacterium]|nr:hypothetical protein [Phycisphaerae bacterium]